MPIFIPTAPSARVAIGGFTSDGSSPTTISGLGFKPKVIIFFAIDETSPPRGHSWGFDDATHHRCTWVAGDLSYVDGDDAMSIYLHRDASNYLRGYVSSMGADGFTITWNLTGSVSVRAQYQALE